MAIHSQVSSFDGRWCHGFQWRFSKAALEDVFGGAKGGRESRGAAIASAVLNRALEVSVSWGWVKVVRGAGS